MRKKNVLVWFRNDLRLHDNEALVDAVNSSEVVFPVFVFDPRTFCGNTRFGFRKTGIHRARFILDSVKNLRDNLRRRGSDLIVRFGFPEEEIFALAKKLGTSWVFCNRERTQEEVEVQDALEQNLWSVGQEVRYSRGKMLYYTSDLPFPVTHTPDSFTQFRKDVERIVPVRAVLPIPDIINSPMNGIQPGKIPGLGDFGIDECEIDGQLSMELRGGETEALRHLDAYFEKWWIAAKQKEDTPGQYPPSSISCYLAQGCLSPKKVYKELKIFQEAFPQNDWTVIFFHSLMWRDYFRLVGKKYGNAIFQKGGVKGEFRDDLNTDETLFNVWSEARTGVPLVDAAIRQLNETGFIEGNARQAAASFLVNDLQVDWRMGAEYYESLLIDYDPCSNYVNWNYITGIGNDQREPRQVPILFQSKKYDPDGEYLRKWIPELRTIPDDRIHQPTDLSEEEALDFGIVLGKDYPRPVTSPS